MKTAIIALFAALTLAACGKKEEVKPVESTPASAVVPAAAPAPAPAASEPAKTEEVKK